MKKNIYTIIDIEPLGAKGGQKYVQTAFDIAYRIIDRYGKIYSEGSFLVHEYFYRLERLRATNNRVNTAKARIYDKRLKSGHTKIEYFYNIMKLIEHEMACYDSTHLVAYNISADKRYITKTCETLNCSINLFEDTSQIHMCLQSACIQTLGLSKSYRYLAQKHRNVTPTKKSFSSTAESFYRQTIGDWKFKERHIAYDDVIIESELLVRVLRQKKKIDYSKNPPTSLMLIKRNNFKKRKKVA